MPTTGRLLLDQLYKQWLEDGQYDGEITILDILDDLATLRVEGASEMYFLALKKSKDADDTAIPQKR
jgi:hypothetical protein